MDNQITLNLESINLHINPLGFYLEYNEPDGEGGGDEYELFSNEHSLGITGVYETLEEALVDCREVVNGNNPL
jgi:hypothetical protein